ncbi:MAG: tetratricopeptide repeat protein [Gallionella sp.]|jgi:tetratricopeptide (TPR) repeat protein
MIRAVLLSLFIMLVAGCYNPLNRVTADRYGQTCREAEASERLDVAEEACRRALINVRIGHLGSEAESEELYNFSRIKLQLGKQAEAEELLKESLKIQEELSPQNQAKIGRRLTNLAIVFGNLGRFKDAWPYLERLLAISDQYTGQERIVVKTLFEKYAGEYEKLGLQSQAAQLSEKAKAL